MDKINLQEKFSQICAYWSPKIIGEINDSCVKIAKLKGEFLWHSHENEDEMFYVFQGELTIRFRDRDVALSAGECLVIRVSLHPPHRLLVRRRTQLGQERDRFHAVRV